MESNFQRNVREFYEHRSEVLKRIQQALRQRKEGKKK